MWNGEARFEAERTTLVLVREPRAHNELRGVIAEQGASFNSSRKIDGQPTDQLAHVQKASNGLKRDRSSVSATCQSRCDQWQTRSIHRPSTKTIEYRCLPPMYFTVSVESRKGVEEYSHEIRDLTAVRHKGKREAGRSAPNG